MPIRVEHTGNPPIQQFKELMILSLGWPYHHEEEWNRKHAPGWSITLKRLESHRPYSSAWQTSQACQRGSNQPPPPAQTLIQYRRRTKIHYDNLQFSKYILKWKNICFTWNKILHVDKIESLTLSEHCWLGSQCLTTPWFIMKELFRVNLW